jgi:hypothetical protein
LFEKGDPAVVGCDIKALHALMEHEDMLMDFINPSAHQGSAKHGKQTAPPAPDKPDKPPPCNTMHMQVAYPPTNSIKQDHLKTKKYTCIVRTSIIRKPLPLPRCGYIAFRCSRTHRRNTLPSSNAASNTPSFQHTMTSLGNAFCIIDVSSTQLKQ